MFRRELHNLESAIVERKESFEGILALPHVLLILLFLCEVTSFVAVRG